MLKRMIVQASLWSLACNHCRLQSTPSAINAVWQRGRKTSDCGPAHLPCDKPVSYEPIKYKYDNVQVVADEGQLFMAVPGPLHNKLVRMHTTWSYVMRISANRVDHLQSECIEKAEKHAKFRSLMIPEGEVRDEHVGYWPATTHFLVMYACIQEGIPMNHAVLLRRR